MNDRSDFCVHEYDVDFTFVLASHQIIRQLRFWKLFISRLLSDRIFTENNLCILVSICTL